MAKEKDCGPPCMLSFTVWYFLRSSFHTTQHGSATNRPIVGAGNLGQLGPPMGRDQWEGLLGS